MRTFHFHKWRILSVRVGKLFEAELIGGFVDGKFVDYTQTKERCDKCNKVRQRNIRGDWTLEELQT